MDCLWRIELLGWLRAVRGDQAVSRFRTQKAGALLAYLAFYRHRSHPREELIELLWPEEPPEIGRERLRTTVAILRRQLEPPEIPRGAVFIATRAAVQLNPSACTTDVAEFEMALQAAPPGRGLERAPPLEDALALYRGDLLPGYFEAWILPERERLAEAYRQALGQLARHFEQEGDLSRALGYARQAVAADTLCEETQEELIRLLTAAGQPEAARRQRREMERLFQEKLGVLPESPANEPAAAVRRRPPMGRRPAAITAAAAPPTAPSADVARHGDTLTFLLVEMITASGSRDPDGESPETPPDAEGTRLFSHLRAHGGHPVGRTRETVISVFGQTSDALAAAVAARECISRISYSVSVGMPDTRRERPHLRSAPRAALRMALHTGDVEPSQCCYEGPALDHAMRLLLAAHPDQLLISEITAGLIRDSGKPGVRLIDLGRYRLRPGDPAERLFQVAESGPTPASFPPPKAIPAHAPSLPLPLTRFFGRETEVEALIGLLGGSRSEGAVRLITLTGPGGSGKTRLALEAARRLPSSYPIRIQFVPLADLSEPRWIVDRIRDALQLPRSPHADPREQVTEALTGEPTLLVLDNFEQLLPDGAVLIQVLLQRVESLRLLVTSRQRIEVPGELEFPVGPLPVPVDGSWSGTREAGGVDGPAKASQSDPSTINRHLSTLAQSPSVQLFVDRAQQARPDFQLTARNAASVAALCHRLEGIPLAIELAAARSLQMTPARMFAEIERRFDLLVSRKRDFPERHRTLRAALDWSHQLLSPPLQRFFARLSVFRGGWTRAAAAAVCEQPEAGDYLSLLRACSLVLLEDDETDVRYLMLETIREYAAEQLSPAARTELSRRHAEHLMELAEQAEPHFGRPEEGAWTRRLEVEHDNLRAALAWCRSASDGAEMGLRLAGAAWRFWERWGHLEEARRWFDDLLSRTYDASAVVRARALYGAAFLAYCQADYASASRSCSESLRLLRPRADAQAIAHGVTLMTELTAIQGDHAKARSLLEEAIAWCRESGDARVLASAYGCQARLAGRQGDWRQATEVVRQQIALHRQVGDRHGLTGSLAELGHLLVLQGDYSQATVLFEEVLNLCRKLPSPRGIPLALWHLGNVACRQGRYEQAGALLQQSLSLFRQAQEQQRVAAALSSLGVLEAYQGNYVRARALQEEVMVTRRRLGDDWDLAIALDHLGWVALRQCDAGAARAFYDEGLAIFRRLNDRRGIAGVLCGLACLAHHHGDHAAAGDHFRRSLAIRRTLGDQRGIAECLEGLASVTATAHPAESAARFLGAAEALRETLGAPIPMAERAAYERTVEMVRAALGEAVLTVSREEGRTLALEQVVVEALEETPLA